MAPVTTPVQAPAASSSAPESTTRSSSASCSSSLPPEDDVMLHVISFCDHFDVSKLIFVSHRFRDLVDLRMKAVVEPFFCNGDYINLEREEWPPVKYKTQFRPQRHADIMEEMKYVEDMGVILGHNPTLNWERSEYEMKDSILSSNLADRKHLVLLALHHCDIDAFFDNKCDMVENNTQADQVRKERFHLYAQDFLMKDDEVNELDFVADDEEPPEYGESECPWSIKLKLCNETIDKASAIKIFFKLWRTNRQEYQHDTLWVSFGLDRPE